MIRRQRTLHRLLPSLEVLLFLLLLLLPRCLPFLRIVLVLVVFVVVGGGASPEEVLFFAPPHDAVFLLGDGVLLEPVGFLLEEGGGALAEPRPAIEGLVGRGLDQLLDRPLREPRELDEAVRVRLGGVVGLRVLLLLLHEMILLVLLGLGGLLLSSLLVVVVVVRLLQTDEIVELRHVREQDELGVLVLGESDAAPVHDVVVLGVVEDVPCVVEGDAADVLRDEFVEAHDSRPQLDDPSAPVLLKEGGLLVDGVSQV
mmetsp:Transcript_35700/g.114207  ORF Transcript_35700/g.114207 Transcript_35700/m.114207 type:complete len:257 (-) Transcript_35700:1025-1795(-)